MAENKCPQCGAPIDPGAAECKFCGEKIVTRQAAQQPQPNVVIQQTISQQVNVPGVDPAWPVKNKLVAGLLGIILGGIGAHKFYLGKIGMVSGENWHGNSLCMFLLDRNPSGDWTY